MTVARQLPLALQNTTDWSRAAFLVGDCNRKALAWVERWPDWPQGTLAIYGPKGSGKTHLCHISASLSGAPITTLDALGEYDWRSHKHLIIDGGALNESGETQLFHVINWVREEGGSLLLATETPPTRLAINLKDAKSRLNALVSAEIGQPDDVLLSQLIVKRFSDMGVMPPPDVTLFLEKRVGRSFREIANTVLMLNQAALAEKTRITVPFVKRVMSW